KLIAQRRLTVHLKVAVRGDAGQRLTRCGGHLRRSHVVTWLEPAGMCESGRRWMTLLPAPTGLPGPAAASSASSSQPGRSPWLLRYQTPRLPEPARHHEPDRLPCPLRRSAVHVHLQIAVRDRRAAISSAVGIGRCASSEWPPLASAGTAIGGAR